MPEGDGLASAPEQVSAGEMYRLRRALLRAERLSLLAQLAQSRAKALLLALERKYRLLEGEGRLDIASGRITRETAEIHKK